MRSTETDTDPSPLSGRGRAKARRQDDLLRTPWGVLYPLRERARSWVDETGSYASNEICINWNASLAFAVGYLALEGRTK